ncbi:MAG: hypothetical protein NT062_19100, partial [Proteobacteria bacterium]|nr:hypothetical protein [Pseudomonadota bacterium]
ALDAEEAARLAELEARRETWLGPVAHVTRLRAWSRGLLDYAQLGKRDQGVVDLAIGHPAWHTVRHLDGSGYFFAVDDIARLVGQSTLRSLRTLMIDSRIAHKLAAEPAADRFDQLTSLAITHHGAPITAEAVAALEATMPRLHELVVGARALPDLRAIFAITRVRTVVLQDPGFLQLAALRTQLEQVSSSVEEVRFATWWRGFDSTGAMLGLRRGLDRRWSALELGWSGPDFPAYRLAMISTLAALPPDTLTRVTIRRSTVATPFDDVGFVLELRRALRAQHALAAFEL